MKYHGFGTAVGKILLFLNVRVFNSHCIELPPATEYNLRTQEPKRVMKVNMKSFHSRSSPQVVVGAPQQQFPSDDCQVSLQ